MQYPQIPWWQRIIQRLAMIEMISTGFLKPYLHRLDTTVLQRSKGRISLTSMLTGLPVVVLSSTGAKSGKTKKTPLVGIPDQDKIILIASWFGSTSYPGWYYNLLVNPEVELSQNKITQKYIARLASPEERQEYWQIAVYYYPGYQAYQKRCERREIPIFILEPLA
jgi:deazaflavin-dependent oxidoreductase (nitroreductase family)